MSECPRFSAGRFSAARFSAARFRAGTVQCRTCQDFFPRKKVAMEQNIQSKRSKKKLLHNETLYVYEKLSKDGERKFWRCEFFGSPRIHTDLNDNVVNDKIGVHSCKTDATRVEVQRVLNDVKRRAVDTYEAPATIRSASLQNVATPVLASFPSVAATRLIVKRVRREINAAPPVPLDLTQLEIPIEFQRYTRTNEIDEQYLLADSGVFVLPGQNIQHRILIFGREKTRHMAHQINHIYADGTFSISPTLFSQVYVLLGRFESITMDFEQAMVNAVQAEFPSCTLRFCFFHLVRNLKKKIDDVHLTKRYRTEALFAQQARMITSLAFVPLNDLRNACAALEAHLPVELLPVFQWFLRNYIGQPRFDGTLTRPLFSPERWSVYQRTLDGACRTNNFAEAFHRKLQSAFGCDHPTLWTFIDKLRQEQKVQDVAHAKFEAGQNPPKKRNEDRLADERILRLVQSNIPFDNAINHVPDHEYANLQNIDPYYNIIIFLTGISRNYLMDA
uniref:MULE transposase domain-containing protein n=1 Tax=Globodera rostochiensis TaxID=31243 RepID=A0A914I181_GLORO